MKKFDKIILAIFSVIILIEGIIVNLLIVGWLDYPKTSAVLKDIITTAPSNKGALIIAVLSMLLAIKALFWGTPADKREQNQEEMY